MNNSSDNIGNENPPLKKKRRTIIKTCTFCRKRKLKCDKRKPRCSSCVTRNLPECVYIDGTGSGATSPDTPSSSTGNAKNYSTGVILPASVGEYNYNLSPRQSSGIVSKRKSTESVIDCSNCKITSSINSDLNTNTKQTTTTNINAHSNSDTLGCNHVSCTNPHSGVVNILDAEYRACYPQSITMNSIPNSINPLSTVYIMQMKPTGKILCFGPTSIRSFMHLYIQHFQMHKQVWSHWQTVRSARSRWKLQHNFSMLKELYSVEELYTHDSNCMIDELCAALPTYEEILRCIETFFNESELYIYNNVLDKNKVLNDFYREFTPTLGTNADNTRNIVGIKVDRKKNFFKSGVILMILCLTKWFSAVPPAVNKFLIFLTGFSSSKIYYVERAQFLLLRIFHRSIYHSNGGDNSTLIDLTSDLCTNCTITGLSHNIDTLFKGKEDIVGRLDTLKNLWIWCLYVDFDVSFHVGKPFFISKDYFFEFSGELNDSSQTFMGLIKRFLKLSRPMFRRMMDREQRPDLRQDEELIITFIESEFPSIKYYTDEHEIYKVNINNIRVLASSLSMLVCNYAVRFVILKEHDMHVKVGFITAAFVAFSLSTNLLIRCFEIDKLKYPKMIDPSCKEVTPYVALANYMTTPALSRSLLSFIMIIHFKLTTLSSPPLFLIHDESKIKFHLDSLRGPDQDFSLESSFDAFCKIFDRWALPKDPDMHQVMRRSYSFIIATTVERLGRNILTKILDHRKDFEATWFAKSKANTGLQSSASSSSVLNVVQEDPTSVDNGESPSSDATDVISTSSNNPINTHTNTTTINNSNNIDSNITNANIPRNEASATPNNANINSRFYQEFWNTYNQGFEDIFNDSDTKEILDELSLFDDLELFG
ncbi:hypothetical protein TBLA_0G00520 [Henningerozyma blattae CBS 6284]|uniref:Zn(2)-C6 fungal-type domain-containing protein n=1 Tax=Henningerozyma blattae (strain ATCC 34711 / CBS 6284 / DSM 70876 / NBRC 10599 / NRRL Y-10934 / UCD 77-7) TaxID=1071380 RepID=I2H6J9_HENB6|nr:hypothetical protein TBLA_0G00520 [Tetrapisispora blattae CBS 6284]CCH62001.1 hypothetical protein TBLA_0G00520 [Tetrapisispora blattae CBS 6284]